MSATTNKATPEAILARADALRRTFRTSFRDQVVEGIYSQAQALADRSVRRDAGKKWDLDQRIDRIVTSPWWGLPIMLALLTAILWITIVGANFFSEILFVALFKMEDWGIGLFGWMGAPWWLTGFVWNGVYRGLAWVVSVMLPPMAIFFPIFTILEDLGYLPRIAFNLDWMFRKVGAHGKQSLTMAMGFGCNAAGVVATRIIDSPRERLIAILTNNFVPCNGRWPTLIMLATIFVAAQFPPMVASLVAAGTLLGVVLIGIAFTFITSAILTRTILKGTASAFSLELPPYRRPSVLRILYTSLIDRTLFVLMRAMATAAPAGAVIWILANVRVGGETLAQWAVYGLDPVGWLLGLDGAVMLAYIVAIPANEIVVPTMMMVYAKTGMMMEESGYAAIRHLLVEQNGWTTLTAVSLMLFSLLHNPCGTTIVTIWKETKSVRWTVIGALLPLGIAFIVCFGVANIARLFGVAG
ncbi:MAG: nucleoside recognition domain-containing protein [Bryobacterales bacterium]|nr:nucleoside recognition domain-containing protein [Bryobacterales bacterium]